MEPYALPCLFQGDLSTLRTLRLKAISTWEANTFGALEELVVAQTNVGGYNGRGTSGEVLRLLAANSSLRSITLRDALFNPRPLEASSDVIHMDSLESLVIESGHQGHMIMRLLERLALPASTTLDLHAYALCARQLPLEEVVPTNLSHPSLEPFTAVTRLEMSTYEQPGASMPSIYFNGWNANRDGEPSVSVSLGQYSDWSEVVGYSPLDMLQSIQPFQPTRIIDLTIPPRSKYINPAQWPAFLSSFQELKRLTLEGTPSASVFDALEVRVVSSSSSRATANSLPDTVCPKLDTIRLVCETFPVITQQKFLNTMQTRYQAHNMVQTQVAQIMHVCIRLPWNSCGSLAPFAEICRVTAQYVPDIKAIRADSNNAEWTSFGDPVREVA